jgi:hypothetical protein
MRAALMIYSVRLGREREVLLELRRGEEDMLTWWLNLDFGVLVFVERVSVWLWICDKALGIDVFCIDMNSWPSNSLVAVYIDLSERKLVAKKLA